MAIRLVLKRFFFFFIFVCMMCLRVYVSCVCVYTFARMCACSMDCHIAPVEAQGQFQLSILVFCLVCDGGSCYSWLQR